MSVNAQVIVIKDDTSSVLPPPSARSSLRRRKPGKPEDVEMTQLNRQALLDQIRNRRKKNYECRCREKSPPEVPFGKKLLNRQLSKSVNDVKEVAGPVRKSSSSQALVVPARGSCCNLKDLRVEFRSSRARTLNDLTETADLTPEIATCKVVEILEKSQAEASKTLEISKKSEDLVEEVKPKSPKQILKRQLSKSVNDISISGGHFELKVIGSEKIALSQIWTVPTNCGCCEPGKEGECKRLKVQELRQKFTKEEVSPLKLKTQEPEISKVSEIADNPAKTTESEKLTAPEIPKADEKVQQSTNPKIPSNPTKTTESEKAIASETPKEGIIPAIPAKTTEPEKSKPPEIPKIQDAAKEPVKSVIPVNPAKSIEPEKPKVAEVPKPKEVVKETAKPVVSAKPAETPNATTTNTAEVEEDANIIVKVLTWMGFWSKPTEPAATTVTTTTATTTVAATKSSTTTTTVAATKPTTTTTAPITATTAATGTIPTTTTSTSSKESPPKPATPPKPDNITKPEWVELQVPVVPRKGTAKDANESSTKSTAKVLSRLFLNVLVEAGSGMISIIPVASCELLIKTSVYVRDAVVMEQENLEEAKKELNKVEPVQKQQQIDMYTGPGLYFAIS